MKSQNRMSLLIITVLMSSIFTSGNNSSVFGQVRIDSVARINNPENNRSISYLSNGGRDSRLIVGTDRGNIYSYEVDKTGNLLIGERQYEYRSRNEDTIRNIGFNFNSDGYFLTNNRLFSMSAGNERWMEILDFRSNSGASFPVLWSMGVSDEGRACIVGVYYKNETTTIEKELFTCTDDVNNKKLEWRSPKFSPGKSKYVQLTGIYFNRNSEGWVSGTDGFDGIIWYTENGVDWKEETATVSEPLLSIAGVNDKLFAVGLNGLIVKRSFASEVRDRMAVKKPYFKIGDRVKINAGKLSGSSKMDLEITGKVIDKSGDLVRIKVDKISPNDGSLNLLSAFFEKIYFNQDDLESDDVSSNSDNRSLVKWVTVTPASRKKASPVRERLNSIKFAKDGAHGFIAGNNGTIFYTTNGGDTWELLSSAEVGVSNLYSIAIDDTNKRCFIAGSEGKVVIISFGNTFQMRN